MFKALICIAATLLSIASASAQNFIRFSGGGYVTSASGCVPVDLTTPNIFTGMFLLGSYLPANLGDNGPNGNVSYTSLPQVVQPFAINLRSTGAFPTASFVMVNGTMVSVVADTHNPRAKLVTTPATITATTPSVRADLFLRNANGMAGCNVTISLGLRRNP